MRELILLSYSVELRSIEDGGRACHPFHAQGQCTIKRREQVKKGGEVGLADDRSRDNEGSDGKEAWKLEKGIFIHGDKTQMESCESR